jgi:hypothetical protein
MLLGILAILITLAVAVAVALLGWTALLGAVRGPADRLANQPWLRVFMGVVALALGTLLLGLLNAVVQMTGHLLS